MSMTWEGYFDSVNTHKYPIPLVLRASQSYWLPSGRFLVSFAWGIPSVCRAFLLVVYLTHLCGPFKTRVKYCFLQKIKVKLLSPVWHFGTPWTVAYEAPPSMGFPRQEYWSGVPLLEEIISYLRDEILWSHLKWWLRSIMINNWVSQVALVVKNPPANAIGAVDTGSIPGLGRSPGEERGNPWTWGAWKATIHRVTKNWTWLKQLSARTHTIINNMEMFLIPDVCFWYQMFWC